MGRRGPTQKTPLPLRRLDRFVGVINGGAAEDIPTVFELTEELLGRCLYAASMTRPPVLRLPRSIAGRSRPLTGVLSCCPPPQPRVHGGLRVLEGARAVGGRGREEALRRNRVRDERAALGAVDRAGCGRAPLQRGVRE